jgi:hypothetical protein
MFYNDVTLTETAFSLQMMVVYQVHKVAEIKSGDLLV